MTAAANFTDPVPRSLFQIGKGGVGKSTLSALTALAHARAGHSVLLLSLDPAHNQSDIFGLPFGDEETALHLDEAGGSGGRLSVMEPDVDAWIRRYLEQVQQRMRENYRYLTALNLDQYFRVLRHSPGLEEFALRAIFQETLRKHSAADIIVVDMPPTALAQRFFASPTVSGLWTDELLRLRTTIKEKREIITRIRFGNKELEQDRVLTRLREERDANEELRTLFADPERCRLTTVVNPDTLSWMEARRIVAALEALGIRPSRLAVNRWHEDSDLAQLPGELAVLPRLLLPHSDEALIGLPKLTAYLENLGTSLLY